MDPADLQRQRVPIARSISLKFKEFRGFVTEMSENVSLGGMFIRTDEPKDPGTVFDFEMTLSDTFPLVQGIGEVVWVRPEGDGPDRPAGMGVRFLHLSPESAKLVHKLVDEHVRTGGKPFDLEQARPPAPKRPVPPPFTPVPEWLEGGRHGAPPPTPPGPPSFVPPPRPPAPRRREPVEAVPSPVESARLPSPLDPAPLDPAPQLDDWHLEGLEEVGLEDHHGLGGLPPGLAEGDDRSFELPLPEAAEDLLGAAVEPLAPSEITPSAALVEPTSAPFSEGGARRSSADVLDEVARSIAALRQPSPKAPPPAPIPAATEATAADPARPWLGLETGPEGAPPPSAGRRRPGRRTPLVLGALAVVAALVAILALRPELVSRWRGGGATEPREHGAASPETTSTPPAVPTVPAETVQDTLAAPAAGGEPWEPDSLAPPAEALENIVWQRDGDRLVVTLLADGPIEPGRFSHFRLDEPAPREVVRLTDLSRPYARTVIPVDDALLTRIRTGWHERRGSNELHVVLDVAAPDVELLEITPSGTSLRLVLGRAD